MTPFHLLAFAVSFSMVGVCIALALAGGSNPLTVVTARALVTVLALAGWLRFAGLPFAMTRRDLVLAALIALPLTANNYLLNAAFGELPVPLVVLIFYLWPALTTAISWLMDRERFRLTTAAGLVLAFAGVALALKVDFTAAQMKGVWYALGASFTWSATFLLIGHFFRGRDTRVPTFYMVLTALTIFIAALAISGALQLPHTAPGWVGFSGTGLFYAFALIGLFTATARIGPIRAGFYMNFEPIATVLLAALILGQTLAPVQLAGAALVICALFLFHFSRASPSRRS